MTRYKPGLVHKISDVKRLIFLLLVSCFFLAGYGQLSQSAMMDAGMSTISSDGFFRIASVSEYKLSSFHGSAGFQWVFSGDERKNLSGGFLAAGRDFSTTVVPFTADLFFRVNPYSSLTRETNFGFLLKYMRSHLEIHAGYHVRYYLLSSGHENTGDLNEGADRTIWEYRNFIYRGTLHLNKPETAWNLSLSVTNFDHFLIQQETNPLLTISGKYKLAEESSVFAEFWMQNAGMLNLHPNFYGFYFRTGLKWQFGR